MRHLLTTPGLFTVLVFLMPGLLHAQSNSTVNLDNYNLVFHDEFNGSEIDTSKWNTSHLWGPFLPINNERQHYVDSANLDSQFPVSPFQFTGTTLKIIASKQPDGASAPSQPVPTSDIWKLNPDYYYNEDYDPNAVDYLSGIITSYDSFRFTYGYVETRAKIPKGRGLWPAFWIFNGHYVEDFPEIDIMENLGHETNKVFHSYHYTDIEQGWNTISLPTMETIGPDYSADFHTYAVSWSPDEVVWYVDGVEAARITDKDANISKQSMFILANLAVGGNWPGDPGASTVFPAEYELDYIRVYQKKSPAVVTPTVLQEEFDLVFSDEFSGSSLDLDKWNTSYLWGPFLNINNEEQFYPDIAGLHQGSPLSPFQISNGTLKIKAREVESSALPEKPESGSIEWSLYREYRNNPAYNDPDYMNNGDASLPASPWIPGYTSGVITSYDAFKFVNGYVEVRAKVPAGSGLWPAFWLLNAYYVGNLPEIDVMELQGEHPDRIHQSYHYSIENGQVISTAHVEDAPDNIASYADDFHTYAVHWGPDFIHWYIDGEITRTVVDDNKSRQLMYIILNLAVGGNFVGAVDELALPATFEIDYVRAYKLRSAVDNCPGLGGSARLGNQTWLDSDQNGFRNSSEPMLANVGVELINECGDVIASKTTAENGFFVFSGLQEGGYTLRFTSPEGYELTVRKNAIAWGDSNPDPSTGITDLIYVADDEYNSTIDAGFIPVTPACDSGFGGGARVGNQTWMDTDFDGFRDSDEPLLENVLVELIDACATVIATSLSNSNGWFNFSGLRDGAYRLRFTPPAGLQLTAQGSSVFWGDSDPHQDNGQTDVFYLQGSEYNSTIDAGFVNPVLACESGLGGTARIGNQTWQDSNANGFRDTGEPMLADVTVELFDSCNSLVATSTSDSNGIYVFRNLRDGSYTVRFIPPPGYSLTDRNAGIFWGDSDPDPDTGFSATIELGVSEFNSTIDAGFRSAP